MATVYPEHDKLTAVVDKSQAIGEFLEWLGYEKEAEIAVRHDHTEDCEWDEEECEADFTKAFLLACGYQQDSLQPIGKRTEDLLAEYFGIDLNRLEDEKREMLEQMHTANAEAK